MFLCIKCNGVGTEPKRHDWNNLFPDSRSCQLCYSTGYALNANHKPLSNFRDKPTWTKNYLTLSTT